MRWRMPKASELQTLGEVLTVSDVARHWYVSRWAVRRACVSGALVARQDTRGRWLIHAASVREYWGAEVLPLPELPQWVHPER